VTSASRRDMRSALLVAGTSVSPEVPGCEGEGEGEGVGGASWVSDGGPSVEPFSWAKVFTWLDHEDTDAGLNVESNDEGLGLDVGHCLFPPLSPPMTSTAANQTDSQHDDDFPAMDTPLRVAEACGTCPVVVERVNRSNPLGGTVDLGASSGHSELLPSPTTKHNSFPDSASTGSWIDEESSPSSSSSSWSLCARNHPNEFSDDADVAFDMWLYDLRLMEYAPLLRSNGFRLMSDFEGMDESECRTLFAPHLKLGDMRRLAKNVSAVNADLVSHYVSRARSGRRSGHT